MTAYIAEFPSDIERQETTSLLAYEITDVIYHSMSSIWKNKMIEQGFNYIDSTIKKRTVFCATRVENLEPKEDYSSTVAEKTEDKKSTKKRKRENCNSSVVEYSEESSVDHMPVKK